MNKTEFIQKYTSWLETRLQAVLPENAEEYRMVEVARRQTAYRVNYILRSMGGGDNPAEIRRLKKKFENRYGKQKEKDNA
jgi:hypothetical protein